MKLKQSIRRMLAFGALAALGSCSNFLDKEPLGVVTQDNLFKDPVNATQTINGVYDVISWDQGPKWGDPSGQYITHIYEWMFGDILSNDAEKGSTPSDFLPVQELKEWTLTPSHGPVGALWTHNFTGIARANTVINNIDAGTIPDDMKQRLKGEALFLRAYFYFYLVRTVGGVPLFENVVLPGDAANVQRSSIADTYAFIEKDLKAAIELLPEKSKVSAAELGRATKGAARGYLARVIMYQIGTVNAANHTWQDVYDLTSTIIMSGEYSLGTNYAALLQTEQEDGPESVFEIEFLESAQGYGPIKTGTTSNVFQNNRKTFGYGFNNPTQNLYDEFEANDPRRLVTFIKDGDVVLGIKNEVLASENATGYLSRKVAILQPVNNQSAGQNSRKIRYADILLMKAEAAAYLGKSGEAVGLVKPGARPRPAVDQAQGHHGRRPHLRAGQHPGRCPARPQRWPHRPGPARRHLPRAPGGTGHGVAALLGHGAHGPLLPRAARRHPHQRPKAPDHRNLRQPHAPAAHPGSRIRDLGAAAESGVLGWLLVVGWLSV